MSGPEGNNHWRTLGFPPGTTMQGLATCYPARCVVVLACRASEPVRSDRIFIRAYADTVYREVLWPDGTNSFDDPVVSHSAPELYVLGQSWRDVQAHDEHGRPGRVVRGCDVRGLYRVTLPQGETELVHSGGGAKGSDDGPGQDSRSWRLSRLLGFTPDGTRLLVKIGTDRVESNTTTCHYGIAAFDPRSGEIEELTPLPGVFA